MMAPAAGCISQPDEVIGSDTMLSRTMTSSLDKKVPCLHLHCKMAFFFLVSGVL
jgi:hypothetical protein